MSTSRQLARRYLRRAVALVLQQLTGVTVDSPGDWDTPATALPNIKLRALGDIKDSTSRSMPAFTTVAPLQLLARVRAQTAAEAQDAIEALGLLIEDSVLIAPSVIPALQQIAKVTTKQRISADGEEHYGELEMQIDCETFEQFDPAELAPQLLIDLQQLVINLDTIKPFDPGSNVVAVGASVVSGVGGPLSEAGPTVATEYPDPPFPDAVVPAPRSSGPDGRNEARLVIDLNATP